MKAKYIEKTNLENKIAIIMGTRPGIIKMAPLVKECRKRNLDNFIIHTGQHYSYNMDMDFFKTLELPAPFLCAMAYIFSMKCLFLFCGSCLLCCSRLLCCSCLLYTSCLLGCSRLLSCFCFLWFCSFLR